MLQPGLAGLASGFYLVFRFSGPTAAWIQNLLACWLSLWSATIESLNKSVSLAPI